MIRAVILAAVLLPSMAIAQVTAGPPLPENEKSYAYFLKKRLDCQWVENLYHCILDPKQVVIDNLKDFIKPEISGENDESKLTCVDIDGSEFRICKSSNGKQH